MKNDIVVFGSYPHNQNGFSKIEGSADDVEAKDCSVRPALWLGRVMTIPVYLTSKVQDDFSRK